VTRRATAAAAALVAAIALHADARAAAPLAGTIVDGTFQSTAGPLGYDVYLPPGYATSGLSYPVVYYLHGLPAGPEAYRTFGYVAHAVDQAGLKLIVVAPQGATQADPDPEYLDAGPGDDWETAIAVQLPHLVDSLYRTIPDRSARALVGVSAGGYGAMLLGLHHLGLFSAIESWSGYFHPTDPTGTRSVSSRPWLSAHTFVSSLRRAFAVHPTFIAYYVGSLDTRFRAENVEFARELSHAGVPFTFRMYPAGHTQTLWSVQAVPWLTLLAARLAAPRTG
jgi:S-formylglutathione hydrolase FrmB